VRLTLWSIAAACVACFSADSAQAQQPSLVPTPASVSAPKWVPDPAWPYADFAQAWPARVRLPESSVSSRLGVIREHSGPILGWYQRFAMSEAVEVWPEDTADAAAFLHAMGVDPPGGPDGKPLPASVQFERRGGYVVSFEANDNRKLSQTPKPQDRPELLFKYISGEIPGHPSPVIVQEPARGVDGKPGTGIELQRTSFALFEPYADAEALKGVLTAEKSRGIALVMPGLFGTPDPVIDALVRRLRQDRWFVLRLLAASSRFTEHVEFVVDPTIDMTEQAKTIGTSLGNRAAEIAYAVEAAFAHVESRRPDLATLHRVVIGGSAGAITLPTVVAREVEKYKAAVFVGGAVDFWLINYRSNYRRGVDAIHVEWKGRDATDAEQRTLDELIVRHSPLDSFHTTEVLRDKPVFILHGALDRAVPAALGDVLWERLRRPRRLSLQVGHELLFAGLASRLDEIVPWLARAATLDKREPEPAAEDGASR